MALDLAITPHLNCKRKHGRTKANSIEKYFCYVCDNPTVTFIICFLTYACAASDCNQGITMQTHTNNQFIYCKDG